MLIPGWPGIMWKPTLNAASRASASCGAPGRAAPCADARSIGASSVRQLEDSLAALNNLAFGDEELARIE